MKHVQRLHTGLDRIRGSIILQEQVRAERAFKGHEEEMNGFHDDFKGGFAGNDAKKRRGVRLLFLLPFAGLIVMNRRLLLPEGVTAATAPRLQNGEEAPMALEHFATLVDCITQNLPGKWVPTKHHRSAVRIFDPKTWRCHDRYHEDLPTLSASISPGFRQDTPPLFSIMTCIALRSNRFSFEGILVPLMFY